MLFLFFFSSRRRHTRLQGDWSSDVCSSDLVATGWLNVTESRPTRRKVMKQVEPMRGLWHRAAQLHGLLFVERSSRRIPWRSEERRVGKESRTGRATER